jgi:1,2-dihydroxy-3-keto-5-methylthiopentene dioxygenase
MHATWLDNGDALSENALRAEGVLYAKLPVDGYRNAIEDLKRTRGYVQEDEVHMHAGIPNFDALSAKFSPEHVHDDDEVRFVLEGEGVFDIRSRADRMMHLVVAAGDLIVVPAGRNHRFVLTDAKRIRALRLFKDQSGWVPRYRAASA